MRAYELALVPCERHGPRSWQDAGSCAEAGVAAEPRLASGSDESQKPSPSGLRVSLPHACESAASRYLQQLSGADRPRARVVYRELVLDDLAQGVARQTLDEVKKTRTLERGQLLSGEG
jgi:hypothetical protein